METRLEDVVNAITVCVAGEQFSVSGDDIPTFKYYGEVIMRDYLECIGWPEQTKAPEHTTDGQVAQVLSILFDSPTQGLDFPQFVLRLDGMMVDPSEAMRRSTLHQTLSQHETLKKIARIIDSYNISLLRLHCIFSAWLILRGLHLRIIRQDRADDNHPVFILA